MARWLRPLDRRGEASRCSLRGSSPAPHQAHRGGGEGFHGVEANGVRVRVSPNTRMLWMLMLSRKSHERVDEDFPALDTCDRCVSVFPKVPYVDHG